MASEVSAGNTPAIQAQEVLLAHAVRCWDAEQANANALESEQNFLVTAIAFFLGLNIFQIQWYRDPDRAIADDEMRAAIKVCVFLSVALFITAYAFHLKWAAHAIGSVERLGYQLAGSLKWAVLMVARGWRAHGRWRTRQKRTAGRQQQPVSEAGRADSHVQDAVSDNEAVAESLPAVATRSSHLLALPEDFMRTFDGSVTTAIDKTFENTYAAYFDLLERNIDRANRLRRARRILLAGIIANLTAIVLYLIQI